MRKVIKITKHYFITDNGDKTYFVKPLAIVPSLEEFQKELNTEEKKIEGMLGIGNNN